MNWFSSYTFKANWFATRWWTHVTVPVTVQVGGGGGGGRHYEEFVGFHMYTTAMPNLFEGQEDKGDLCLTELEFDAKELFDNWNPRPKIPPEFTRPKPRKKVRNLDAKPKRFLRKVKKSECSLCRPARMRDVFGPLDVVEVYCVSVDRLGRRVRYLG